MAPAPRDGFIFDMPQRISMRDIAAKAKVSVMTVSLALRGSGRISTTTRERIQFLAEKMGYQPDPALQALVAYVMMFTILTISPSLCASSEKEKGCPFGQPFGDQSKHTDANFGVTSVCHLAWGWYNFQSLSFSFIR